MPGTTRVYDLALRVFHWGLAASFVTAWLTGGHPSRLYWHIAAGQVVTGLLLFRLSWASAGPDTARWRALLVPWTRVREHVEALLDGRALPVVGHNPLGAWAAVAGFGVLLALSLTGLVVEGGEEGHGLLAGIPLWMGLSAHTIHGALAWAAVAWVAAHLVGVAKESLLRRFNLARTMVDGLQPGTRPEGDVRASRGVALSLLAALAGAALYVGAPPMLATAERPFLPYQSVLPQDAAWSSACGDCHLAYHPSLLPARSWARLLDQQHDHFGEDLLLTDAELAPLRAFAAAHSAEAGESEHAVRIAAGVPADQTPIQISDLPWWEAVHQRVTEAELAADGVDGRMDCGACHLDAKTGAFEDGAMRFPKT